MPFGFVLTFGGEDVLEVSDWWMVKEKKILSPAFPQIGYRSSRMITANLNGYTIVMLACVPRLGCPRQFPSLTMSTECPQEYPVGAE